MSYIIPALNQKDPIKYLSSIKSDTSNVFVGNVPVPSALIDSLPQINMHLVKSHSPYGSITDIEIISPGSNYSYSTTLSISSNPEHPSGSAAIIEPIFGINKNSISVSGGYKNSVGDTYIISNEFAEDTINQISATLTVNKVGPSGEVLSYYIQNQGKYFTNSDIEISYSLKDSDATPAQINFYDNYSIVDINIVDSGNGYMFWDELGDQQSIERQIIASNQGSGYGFKAYVYQIDKESIIIEDATNKKTRPAYFDKFGRYTDDTNNIKITTTTILAPISHDPITQTNLGDGTYTI